MILSHKNVAVSMCAHFIYILHNNIMNSNLQSTLPDAKMTKFDRAGIQQMNDFLARLSVRCRSALSASSVTTGCKFARKNLPSD